MSLAAHILPFKCELSIRVKSLTPSLGERVLQGYFKDNLSRRRLLNEGATLG